MSYTKLVQSLRQSCFGKLVPDIDAERRAAADAICYLMDKAEYDDALAEYLKRAIEESAEARAQKAEDQLRRVRHALSEPLIIQDWEHPNSLRPVKNTSRQDVYAAVLKAQKAADIMGRWFPDVWED